MHSLPPSAVPEPGGFVIDSKREPDCLVLSLHGELDLATSGPLKEKLLEAEAIGVGRLIIDLSELSFIDSTGLQTLLMARNRASGRGHELALRRGSRSVQRVFELTGTLEVFSFVD